VKDEGGGREKKEKDRENTRFKGKGRVWVKKRLMGMVTEEKKAEKGRVEGWGTKGEKVDQFPRG